MLQRGSLQAIVARDLIVIDGRGRIIFPEEKPPWRRITRARSTSAEFQSVVSPGLDSLSWRPVWRPAFLRWLAIASLVGGAAIGLSLIAVRNRRARRGAALGGVILAASVATALLIYFR
jgi:hypothetical protein